MIYILEYQKLIGDLIPAAARFNLPNKSLIAHKKEIDLHIKQADCLHDLKPNVIGNVREWNCVKCKKIIDYETIK